MKTRQELFASAKRASVAPESAAQDRVWRKVRIATVVGAGTLASAKGAQAGAAASMGTGFWIKGGGLLIAALVATGTLGLTMKQSTESLKVAATRSAHVVEVKNGSAMLRAPVKEREWPALELDAANTKTMQPSQSKFVVAPVVSEASSKEESAAKVGETKKTLSIQDELEVVKAMRSAIANRDDGKLEAAVRRHRALYLNGVFVEEREAATVILACSRGVADASGGLEQFASRFPNSSHLVRVRQRCGVLGR